MCQFVHDVYGKPFGGVKPYTCTTLDKNDLNTFCANIDCRATEA